MPRPLGQRAGKPRQATETHVCQGGTDCTTAGRWIRCNNNAYRRVRRGSGPGEEVSVGGGGSDACWRPQRRTAPKACHGRKETSHGGLARDLAGGAFPGRRRERRLEHPCAHRRAGQIGADLASAASIDPCAPACGRSRRARRARVALGDLRKWRSVGARTARPGRYMPHHRAGGAGVAASAGMDGTAHDRLVMVMQSQIRRLEIPPLSRRCVVMTAARRLRVRHTTAAHDSTQCRRCVRGHAADCERLLSQQQQQSLGMLPSHSVRRR